MQTAAQLMKKKRVFKAEIDRIMSGDQSDAIWKESTEKLQSIMDRYGKKEHAGYTPIPRTITPHASAFAKSSVCVERDYSETIPNFV